MAAKGTVVQEIKEPLNPETAVSVFGDLLFLAMPGSTFRALSDEAAKRNMTLAQFIAAAVGDYIQKPSGPSLLTENEKNR